jgi:hypothetical protein
MTIIVFSAALERRKQLSTYSSLARLQAVVGCPQYNLGHFNQSKRQIYACPTDKWP